MRNFFAMETELAHLTGERERDIAVAALLATARRSRSASPDRPLARLTTAILRALVAVGMPRAARWCPPAEPAMPAATAAAPQVADGAIR